jgi:RNA-binding protein YlmH
MGFDVFDDIVDHSYDNIVDQSQRLDAVIEQLHKLSRLDLGSLRLQQKSRLLANWQLLDQMAQQQDGQFGKLLRQIGYA